MILAINYADDRYKTAQHFNSKTAIDWGADEVKEYGPESLDVDFREQNRQLLSQSRGGGLWVWKPYIIKDALSGVSEGDYVIYTDAGSAFVNKISLLISAMNAANTDIMAFCIGQIEKKYTKRDAFILMDCDIPEIVESPQICGGYVILKKTDYSCKLVEDWLHYVQDARIVSNNKSVMGKDDYDGFVENRHDQSVWSLLCKKSGIKPFRDPSQYGVNTTRFSAEVNERSIYPQIIESHRNPQCKSKWQLEYYNKLYKGLKKMKRIIRMKI